jgi:hypothetical protein
MPDEIDALRRLRDETPGPSTDAWNRAWAAVEAARAQEAPPPRQHRRAPGPRRRWLFPAATVVTAAAVVATLLAVLLPGSPGTGSGGLVTTDAYVAHVEHALNEAGQDNLMTYARTEYPSGISLQPLPGAERTGATGGVHADTTVRWSYQGTLEYSAYAAGRLVLSQQTRTASSRLLTTVVTYSQRTWWRSSQHLDGPPSAAVTCGGPGVEFGQGGWPGYIRAELSCGGFTLGGRHRVDGIDAIKMTSRHAGLTLWVNPSTYLPVRLARPGQDASVTDFRWLAPTAARLARLNIAIPAHFRQVAAPS